RPRPEPRAAGRCPRFGRATPRTPGGHAESSRPRRGASRHAAARSARARTGRRRTRIQDAACPRRAAMKPPASQQRMPVSGSTIVVLAIAELPLGELAPLLRFHAQGGDRTSLESAQTDLVARLLAVAV